MEEYSYDVSYLIDKYAPEDVTLTDIINEVENVSLDRMCADNKLAAFPDDAITYLFSGRIDGVPSGSVTIAMENARVVNLTY